MEAVSAFWLALAGEVALKSVALMALAGIALLFLRKSSADRRAFFWGCVLASFLLLPAFCVSSRGHEIALRIPAMSFAGAPIAASEKSPVADAVGSRSSEASGKSLSKSLSVALSSPPKSSLSAPSVRIPVQSDARRFDAGVALFGLWLLGFGWTMVSTFSGWVGLARAKRRFGAVSDEALTRAIEAISAEWGMKRKIEVLVSHLPNSPEIAPMTWGFFHPVILMPEAALEWPDSRLRMTLLHEAAHVSRGDWLARSLSRIICAIYWFHPFVWIAARRHRIECDRACDDRVLSAGIRGADYAYCLLETLQAMKNHRKLARASLPMALRSQIETRLVALLDASVSRKTASRGFRAASLFLAIAFLTGAAVVKVSAQSASNAPKKTVSTKPVNRTVAMKRMKIGAKALILKKSMNSHPPVAIYDPKTGKKFYLSENVKAKARDPKTGETVMLTLRGADIKTALDQIRGKKTAALANKTSLKTASNNASGFYDPRTGKNVVTLYDPKTKMTYQFDDIQFIKAQTVTVVPAKAFASSSAKQTMAMKNGIAPMNAKTDLASGASSGVSANVADDESAFADLVQIEDKNLLDRRLTDLTLKRIRNPLDEKKARLTHLFLDLEKNESQVSQLDEKYKAGIITSDQVQDAKTKGSHLEIDIKTIQDQIQRLEKAGYGASGAKPATKNSSPSDDALRQHLMIELDSCRDELNQLQSKYKAGIIPSDDLTDTQYRMKHLEYDIKLMSDH